MTYSDKFMELVKASPDMEEEKLRGFIKTARASSGGKAKAAKAELQRSCSHDFGEDGYCKKCAMKKPMEMCEYFSGGRSDPAGLRLFVELEKDGLTDWVQIAPGPGEWGSPRYGKVDITPETLDNFVENFQNNIYQEHIPVDAEHKTKQSGAFAYYREMKNGHDGAPGLFARLELTDRGKALLDSGAFKYFSPEFYPEWEDPADGQTYKDVITGGAFTTRPFFKDKSLPALQLSELLPAASFNDEYGHPWNDLSEAICDMVYSGYTDDQIQSAFSAAKSYARAMERPLQEMAEEPQEEGETMTTEKATDDTVATEPTQASEDVLRQLSEERSKREALEAQLQQHSESAKAMSEQIASMQAADRRRQFTEIITGRGGSGDGSPQWFGEPEKHVVIMEKMSQAFGEDSDELKEYIDQQNAVAIALKESRAMSEEGKSGVKPGGATSETRFEAKVSEYMAANSGADYAKAAAAVAAEDPMLYSEYTREFNRNKKE
jgi:hypothetical protein